MEVKIMKAKKIFKGMTAAAIAAVLAASMVPMTAFAEGGAVVTADKQTITFNQTVGDESATSKLTYAIYKVAEAKVDGGGKVYNYTLQDKFNDIVNPFYDANEQTDGQKKDEKITIDTISNTSADNAADMKKLADALKTGSAAATAVATVEAGKTAELAPGYYLIVTSGSQMIGAPILLSVRSDMTDKTVNAKTAEIDFNKTIESVTADTTGTGLTGGSVGVNKDTAQVSIGSTVSYKLATSFPKYASTILADNMKPYYITDIPSEGLTLVDKDNDGLDKDDFVVTVGGTPTSDFTVAKEGDNGFKITFTNAFVLANQEKDVVVTYDALVNNKAVVGTAGNPNTANLHFDNNYYEGGGEKDIPDNGIVYTTKLVVNKTFSGFTKTDSNEYPIAGFTLYKKDGNTEIEVASASTTAQKNTIEFKGLAAGTYVLKETSTPDTYKTADPVNITITANGTVVDGMGLTEYDGTYTFTGAKDDGTVEVINVQGQTLPGTGGAGTVIFTVAGAGVVLVAGIMLIVYMKKRKVEE